MKSGREGVKLDFLVLFSCVCFVFCVVGFVDVFEMRGIGYGCFYFFFILYEFFSDVNFLGGFLSWVCLLGCVDECYWDRIWVLDGMYEVVCF